MSLPSPSLPSIRFDGFELDPRTGELVRNGERMQLHEAPLRVLITLIERPGELITREELTNRVWSTGTFVDFERGLNKAVNKLREALGDSAEQPRLIETLPRKGYRFIGTVEPTAALHRSRTTSFQYLCAQQPIRGPPVAMWYSPLVP